MLAVDAIALVRLLARDDAGQAAAADAAVAKGAWVSQPVLAECVGVLDAVYARTPRQLIAARAPFRAKPALAFSDCLVLEIARKDGHQPLATFDKAQARSRTPAARSHHRADPSAGCRHTKACPAGGRSSALGAQSHGRTADINPVPNPLHRP